MTFGALEGARYGILGRGPPQRARAGWQTKLMLRSVSVLIAWLDSGVESRTYAEGGNAYAAAVHRESVTKYRP